MRPSPCTLLLAALAACGGGAGSSTGVSPPAPSIDGFCASLAPRDAPACAAGFAQACMAAVKVLQDPRALPPAQAPDEHVAACVGVMWERACAFGDATGCIMSAGVSDGTDLARMDRFYRYACERSARGCEELATLHQPDRTDKRALPDLSTYEDALGRACDLGSAKGCADLATSLRARDVRASVTLAERACLLRGGDWSGCLELRNRMLLADAPRRDPYDWVPVLALRAEMAAPKPQPPTPPGRGGICEIDPRACPPMVANIAVPDPREGPPGVVFARRLAELDGACAAGATPLCVRRAELEWQGFTHTPSHDNYHPPRFDVRAEVRRLCALGAAEACVHVAYGVLGFDGPTLLRACDLGSARACARVAHDIRAARGDRARVADLYGRACRGGIRWTCTERDSL